MSGIQHSFIEVGARKPLASEVIKAEVIINLVDGTIWTKDHNGVVIQIGGSTGEPVDLTATYLRNGTQPLTAALQAATFPLSNIGDGVALQDAVSLAQLNTKSPMTHNHDLVYHGINDFVTVGTPNSAVKTGADGMLDISLIPISSFEYQDVFTPSAVQEYPSITNEPYGAFWDIVGVGAEGVGGYTFTTGDLTGETIYDNDHIVWGRSGWGLVRGGVDTELVYYLDGRQNITAPIDFQGLFKAIGLLAGTVAGDAIEYTQFTSGLAGKAPTVHTHIITDVDGLEAALAGKAPTVHTHAISDITDLETALANKYGLISASTGNIMIFGTDGTTVLDSGASPVGILLTGEPVV